MRLFGVTVEFECLLQVGRRRGEKRRKMDGDCPKTVLKIELSIYHTLIALGVKLKAFSLTLLSLLPWVL